jgi:hypothetical protein
LAGDDHQRSLVFVGGEHRTQGVTETGGGVQVDQAGVAGRLRIAIRHADRHHLLKGQHITEIGGKIAEHRQFGRAGVAEDRRRAEGAKQVEHRFPHRQLPRRGAVTRHCNLLLRSLRKATA